MIALLLLAQAAVPDIQIGVRVQAREVRIERRGEASLTARAEPGTGTEQRAAPGDGKARTLRNVDLSAAAEATLAPPAETASQPPR